MEEEVSAWRIWQNCEWYKSYWVAANGKDTYLVLSTLSHTPDLPFLWYNFPLQATEIQDKKIPLILLLAGFCVVIARVASNWMSEYSSSFVFFEVLELEAMGVICLLWSLVESKQHSDDAGVEHGWWWWFEKKMNSIGLDCWTALDAHHWHASSRSRLMLLARNKYLLSQPKLCARTLYLDNLFGVLLPSHDQCFHSVHKFNCLISFCITITYIKWPKTKIPEMVHIPDWNNGSPHE